MRSKGASTIPFRGPLAANTVAGHGVRLAKALDVSKHWQKPMARERLLESAIYYAENGIVVTRSQSELTSEKFAELKDQPNFAGTFMPNGQAPAEGDMMKLPALGATLKRLAAEGFESFYNGKLADTIAADLRKVAHLSPRPICRTIKPRERPPAIDHRARRAAVQHGAADAGSSRR